MNNPFDNTYSFYCTPHDTQTPAVANERPHGVDVDQLHEQLRDFIVEDTSYPCVVAKSAFNKRAYRFGVYPDLGSPEAAKGLAHDLYQFIHDNERMDARFATFAALFSGPYDVNERTFERLLWRQLHHLHIEDAKYHTWDQDVSNLPDDKEFGFSFASSAFFIVGMHANSSRKARCFPHPMLVFNLHEQFEELRESGSYERMKKVIRKRELGTQGSLNPMLADFGTHSEAVQYSGRAVSDEWRCPVTFKQRSTHA